MVIYRVDYEQRRINEQITIAKHSWKVKANATTVVQPILLIYWKVSTGTNG